MRRDESAAARELSGFFASPAGLVTERAEEIDGGEVALGLADQLVSAGSAWTTDLRALPSAVSVHASTLQARAAGSRWADPAAASGFSLSTSLRSALTMGRCC